MKGDLVREYTAGYATPPGTTADLDHAARGWGLAISARWRAGLWIAALFGVVLLAQIAAGAYRTELGNYSDESAHFMNALVLRDYITHGLGQNPLAFAEAYYLSYPKIAPLMWPPFFHTALGLFLLPGWAPHQAALAFLALVAALTAYRLSRFVSVFSSGPAVVVVPVIFLLVPIIVDLTTAVMVDIGLAALGLESAWWLTRYVVTRDRRHALLFGLAAACCCLTKGNGVAITLLPAVLILATGRIDLLRRRGLYVSAAIVALLAGPFVYISYRLCDAMGDFTGTAAVDTFHRLRSFIVFLWHQLTPIPFLLAVAGAAGAVHRAWTWAPSRRTIAPAALVALAGSVILFHTLLPLEYYSGRYVAIAVAPLLGLVPMGAAMVVRAAGLRGPQPRAVAGVLALATVGLLFMKPAMPVRRPLGFATIVQGLAAGDGLAGRRLLVISDESGEGAMVTEVAIRQASPAPTVIRGSKLLVDGDWMANNQQMLFTAAPQTLKDIEDLHVDYVVFDASPDAREMPFWSHMKAVTEIAGDRLQPIDATHVVAASGPTRPITVYRVTHRTPGPPTKLRVNLRYSLGKFLEK